MSVEQSVEWDLAGETEVLGENLPQCHFVNHKIQGHNWVAWLNDLNSSGESHHIEQM
jgi:hypothetical protein